MSSEYRRSKLVKVKVNWLAFINLKICYALSFRSKFVFALYLLASQFKDTLTTPIHVINHRRKRKNLNMDNSEHIGYGVALICLSLFFLTIYIPILLIFFLDKEFRRSAAYIIMTNIGVTDTLQLIIHLYSGVLVMGDVNVSSGYNKVIGALLTGLWFATLAFTLFLTINRLITVLLHIWFPVLASPVVTYVLFTLSYLSLVVPFILKLLPDCNYVFDSSTFSWSDLPTDGYLSTVMRRTGKYLIIVTVILSIVTYLLIFCYIACFSAGRLSRREFLITVQVSMLALYFLFSFVYWNY